MGIVTDKLTVGKSVWVSCVKWASQRAETDEHKTSDIGILWAADRMADLEQVLQEIVTISDRKHDAWDRAKAILKVQSKSLLRKVGDLPKGCYCKPGRCMAPKQEWCRDRKKREMEKPE